MSAPLPVKGPSGAMGTGGVNWNAQGAGAEVYCDASELRLTKQNPPGASAHLFIHSFCAASMPGAVALCWGYKNKRDRLLVLEELTVSLQNTGGSKNNTKLFAKGHERDSALERGPDIMWLNMKCTKGSLYHVTSLPLYFLLFEMDNNIYSERYKFFFNFFYFYFTRVEFICNAGLVSGVQQSDSVMHTYFLSFTDSLLIWVITEY